MSSRASEHVAPEGAGDVRGRWGVVAGEWFVQGPWNGSLSAGDISYSLFLRNNYRFYPVFSLANSFRV